MRTIVALLALLLAFPVLAQATKQRVVIQVSDNDPAKWNLALNNARNLQVDLGKGNVEVELVAYGPGLPMLKSESAVSGRLAQALDAGVTLLACENTMRNTKVGKDELYYGIGYVPAGVTHLVKRQGEGWAYIRP
jgi:intracellular sulfur oxidation DsrE/DsrF family protein